MIIEIKLINDDAARQWVGYSIERIMEWLGAPRDSIEYVALNGETIYRAEVK